MKSKSKGIIVDLDNVDNVVATPSDNKVVKIDDAYIAAVKERGDVIRVNWIKV